MGVRTIDLDATIPADLPEDPADVIILDDDELSLSGDYPEAVSTPKIKVASDCKWSSEDTSPRTSPQKKWATEEMESLPPHDVSLPKGTKEKDLLPQRYEVFASDYKWVQHVRGSLLGLEANDSWWSAHRINSQPRRTGSHCILVRASRSTSRLPCQPFQARGYQA